jgi:hypothetical protein
MNFKTFPKDSKGQKIPLQNNCGIDRNQTIIRQSISLSSNEDINKPKAIEFIASNIKNPRIRGSDP